MAQRYTATVTHETHSGDEQTGEYTLKVTFDVHPAEPDVGIFEPSTELVDVTVVESAGMYPLAAADLRASLIGGGEWFEALHDELMQHANDEAEDAREQRYEARHRFDYFDWAGGR